ncbi:hypothetical protein GCM10020216_045990 [Nonomuraea helvata]
MPDVISEAVGRIRVSGADEAMLERVLGKYRTIHEIRPEEPDEVLAWHISYDGDGASPVTEGRRVRVEHETTAIRVPRGDGYELHLPERGATVVRTAGHAAVRGDRKVAAELMRKALRQILTRGEQRLGMIQLHASAVTDAAGGVLAFVGHKGAGKTTTLTAALVHGGMDLVGNDRLCLVGGSGTGQGPGVYGWPTDYPIGHGTLQAAGLWDRVPGHLRDETRKVSFTPEHFASLCGATITPRGTLQAIAFLSMDLTRKDVDFHEREPAESIEEILREHLFDAEDDEDHPDWLGLDRHASSFGREIAAARLGGVRFFRFAIGGDLRAIASGVKKLRQCVTG